MKNEHLIPILKEMKLELINNQLKVSLVPTREFMNEGGMIRIPLTENCSWYKELCADFPSTRKRKNHLFDTRVKRRAIVRVLDRLIDGIECHSKYADWILEYAEKRNEQYQDLENINIWSF